MPPLRVGSSDGYAWLAGVPAQDVDVEVSLVLGAMRTVRALKLRLLAALKPEVLCQTALPPIRPMALRAWVLARAAR